MAGVFFMLVTTASRTYYWTTLSENQCVKHMLWQIPSMSYVVILKWMSYFRF